MSVCVCVCVFSYSCYVLQVTTHDKRRTNLLHAACEMGHADMATFLIERYHMSVEEPDRRGLTPLARASLRNHVKPSMGKKNESVSFSSVFESPIQRALSVK